MLILNTFLLLLLLLTSPWSKTRFSYGETDIELAGNELTLTLAIPCVSRHIRFLDGLFADVSSQTLMPIEVVVALSEAATDEETAIRRSFHDSFTMTPASSRKSIPSLIVLRTYEPQTHAANRNRAAAVATGDIISFVDADDRMHPDRLAVVACSLTITGANAFLHSFVLASADAQRHDLFKMWALPGATDGTTSAAVGSPLAPNNSQVYKCGYAPMVLGEALYDVYHSLPVGQAPRDGALEEDGHGFARVVQLSAEGADASWKFAPHHGHVSIRRHIIGTDRSVSQHGEVDSGSGHAEDTSDRSCIEDQVPVTTKWVSGPGSNGEGEDVLYTNALLQSGGRANYSLAYSPRKLTLYLPTFARRCVALKADGSANALFDCSVSQDGVSVHFSGSTLLPPCVEEGHVQGLSYAEVVAVPGLLEKYAPWAACIDDPAACRAHDWEILCLPFDRRAELAPGITYLRV